MLSADGLIDGSYDITVRVTDLQTDKTIRVRGDVHIGGLMLRVVNALGLCLYIREFFLYLSLNNVNIYRQLLFAILRLEASVQMFASELVGRMLMCSANNVMSWRYVTMAKLTFLGRHGERSFVRRTSFLKRAV